MATFVEVEEFTVLGAAPQKIQIDKDQVTTIKEGDSSGKGWAPRYCIVTFHDGSSKKIKGTEVDLKAIIGK